MSEADCPTDYKCNGCNPSTCDQNVARCRVATLRAVEWWLQKVTDEPAEVYSIGKCVAKSTNTGGDSTCEEYDDDGKFVYWSVEKCNNHAAGCEWSHTGGFEFYAPWFADYNTQGGAARDTDHTDGVMYGFEVTEQA